MTYHKTTLVNGSSLILLRAPSYAVTISAYIKAGFRSDPLNHPGLSHFVEHMMFSGTKKYPTHKELAFAIEQYGGWHSAHTWVDHQAHFVRLPRKNFRNGIDVLLDTMYRSLLRDEEIEKEKQVVKEEIVRSMSDPSSAALPHVWFPLFFQSTPLGRSYYGSAQNIDNITQDAVADYYDSYIRSGETRFIVAGDISLSECKKTMNDYHRMYDVHTNNVHMPKVKNMAGLRFSVKKTDSDYVAIMVGVPTVDCYSDERHSLRILQAILSQGFGARLPDRLRSSGGLVYTSWSSQENFIDTGYFCFETSTHKKNVGRVVQIIMEEFQRFADGDISDADVEITKASLIGGILSNMETGLDYVHWYGYQELLSPENIVHIKDQVRIYEEITKKQILDVAANYFAYKNVYIAACGDVTAEEIENLLL